MSDFFGNFPVTNYGSKQIRDISRRIKFMEKYKISGDLLLPYTVEYDHKPEDVSYHYYGSVDYTWLICLANDIIDPYEDWVLTNSAFEKFIIKKYNEQSKEIGYNVVIWSMNTHLIENIVCFEKDNVFYSRDTVLINHVPANLWPNLFESKENQEEILSIVSFGDYKPVRIYDYEQIINETKRNIVVLDKRALRKVVNEFKELMNQ